MSDLTGINIFDHIGHNFKQKGNSGEWFGACPFCNAGEDRFIVWDKPANGSNPSYWCRRCDKKGDVWQYLVDHDNMSISEAGDKLGISRDNGTGNTATSKRGYDNGQDYASQHGLDMVDLEKRGWKQTTHKGRPALEFPTGFKGEQTRWRFLDGENPAYISIYDFKRSLYGFNQDVIDLAKKENSPLFFCNGEISTIAARFCNVPAITIAGGGEKSIPSELLTELLMRWDGKIAIVLDCDSAGRTAAQKIQEQLGDRGVIVDLGLSDGQDLADYVSLHGSQSLRNLKRLIPLAVNAPMSSREAAQLTTARLDINNVMEGRPFIMPMSIYHHKGGYAKICYPGKLTGIAARSGNGKTSWMNTTDDALSRRGENGVGIKPEFQGDEYQWDRLQRYSGQNGKPVITATMMMEWELWKREHKDGVPIDQRMGYKLSRAEREEITRINDMVEAWRGESTLFSQGSGLEDAFLEMGDYIRSKRSLGDTISYAQFDYIQILKTKSYTGDDNPHEYALGLIKQFCMDYTIHGFVASQVNKGADKSSLADNKVLQSADMRFSRDDKINLMIMLNILHNGSGEKVQIGNTGCFATVANITKNSKGQSGQIKQIADLVHLAWLDQTYSKQSIALDDESFDASNL